MLVHYKRYDDGVWNLHYLIQSSRTKQEDNSLHKMNFLADDHSYINILTQMKLIKNMAIWGAWIIHNKMQSTKKR